MNIPTIRPAEPKDLEAIFAIYNHEVLNSVATFDTEPTPPDQQLVWFNAHAAPRHPIIVAEQANQILGWASLTGWSGRCAYARAVEDSVYIHPDARNQGLGTALLKDVIARGEAAGARVILARIADRAPASVHLHESLGFQTVGIMRRVGEKFGRVIDVQLMDLHLDGG